MGAGMAKEDVMIENYDPEDFSDGGKAYFPFRLTEFCVAPDMAKEKLGYEGARCDLAGDLKWYFENYKARGGPTKKMSLIKDMEITVLSMTRFPDEIGKSI